MGRHTGGSERDELDPHGSFASTRSSWIPAAPDPSARPASPSARPAQLPSTAPLSRAAVRRSSVPPNPDRGTARPVAGRVKHTASALFAFTAAVSFFLVNIVGPYSGAIASGRDEAPARFGGADPQSIEVGGDYELSAASETYRAEPKPAASASKPAADGWAPPAVTPDPGSAQAYAAGAVAARGWGSNEFDCLVALWSKESGWRVNAYSGSGAYGIPQALPGSKMASAGADWETNAATQIEWGLGYIQGRYGTPCGAWAHSEDSGWY